MSGWTTVGVAVLVLGVSLGSAPIVFIGAVILAIRVIAENWPRRVLDRLTYEREVSPRHTVVGDEVDLKLSLWNQSRLPIAWASSADVLSPALKTRLDETEVEISGPLRPFERVTRRVRIKPTKRGVHEIGPVRVRVAEHFGTHAPYIDTELEPTFVIARPLMAPVVGRTDAASPLAQVRARRSLFTDPTLFAGVRPYAPGDPLRTIHWRASGRQGSLQSKRFEPALSRQQVIVLDVQTVEGPYWVLNYDDELFEELCVGALSLARDLISHDAACGFAAAGFSRTTQRFVFLPPRADRAQIERIGDALARLGPESSAPLGQLLSWLPQRVAAGTALVVLTGRGPTEAALVIKRLRESGFPVQLVFFRGGAENVRDTRRLGASAAMASVEMAGRVPAAIVIDG